MNAKWEISGENGAALGPGMLALDALFPLVKPLVFRSQAADSFGYFLPIEGATGASNYLPDRGQFVTLWRDGQSQFRGRVTGRKYIFNGTGQGWEIEIKGGWHELERLPLISNSAPTYDLPQQNLRDSIFQVLDIAIANGAQLQIGNVATMMDCFPLQFRAASIAATLSDLLRFSQDSMTWVDYSTTPPALHITRRTEAPRKTFVLGRDAITQCELSPDDSSVADRVDFVYAQSDANGIVSQITQSAGAEQPKNRIQVVTAEAGFDEFTQRATASQKILRTASGAGWEYAYAADPKLKDIVGLPNPIASGSFTRPVGGAYTTKGSITVTGTTPTLSGFVAPNVFALQSGEVVDYMRAKLGLTSGPCDFAGHFWWVYPLQDALGAVAEPDWVDKLRSVGGSFLAGWWTTGTTGTNTQANPNTWTAGYIRLLVEFKGVAVSREFPVDTIVRDPGEYPLESPPSAIADYVASSISVPSYDGEIVADGYQGYERNLGRVVDVLGGPAELETCRALTREEEHDLQTGQWILRVGQSSAGNGFDLFTRFRRLSAR